MTISREEVIHLAELSSFSVSDGEITSLGKDLNDTVGFVQQQLDELNTDGVEPTFFVCEAENVWRPDEIQQFEANREDLLALTDEVVDNQIKVPKIL